MIYNKIGGPSDLHEIIRANNMKFVNVGTEAVIYSDEKKLLKWFHTPMDKDSSVINIQKKGSELKQSSFTFFDEALYYDTFVYAGTKPFFKEDFKITSVPFVRLEKNIAKLVKDIKTISKNNIEVSDNKSFNMLHARYGFKIIDTTRFITSEKNPEDLFDYNLKMVMGLIEFEYFKGLCGTKTEQVINDSLFLKGLKLDYENWDEFISFLSNRLKIYCDEDVKCLQEAVNILNK